MTEDENVDSLVKELGTHDGKTAFRGMILMHWYGLTFRGLVRLKIQAIGSQGLKSGYHFPLVYLCEVPQRLCHAVVVLYPMPLDLNYQLVPSCSLDFCRRNSPKTRRGSLGLHTVSSFRTVEALKATHLSFASCFIPSSSTPVTLAFK